MNFNLHEHTVFLVVAGSHAYGFATPESDWDYRGIAIPPISTYIGLHPAFEQSVDGPNKTVYLNYPPGLLNDDPRVKPASELLGLNIHTLGPDLQVMELTKFIRLAPAK